jgi:hypothetical protein
MADLWSGQWFEKLERQLTETGIELDPNPDREQSTGLKKFETSL